MRSERQYISLLCRSICTFPSSTVSVHDVLIREVQRDGLAFVKKEQRCKVEHMGLAIVKKEQSCKVSPSFICM
jgi:hypothetical protein